MVLNAMDQRTQYLNVNTIPLITAVINKALLLSVMQVRHSNYIYIYIASLCMIVTTRMQTTRIGHVNVMCGI